MGRGMVLMMGGAVNVEDQPLAIDTQYDRAILLAAKQAFDLANRTWSALTISGNAPPEPLRGTLGYDAPNQRMVYVDDVSFAVHALDTSTPGAETWSPLAVGGVAPALTDAGPLVGVTTQQSGGATSTMYVYATATGNFWKLALGAGSEAWVPYVVDGVPPEPRLGAMTHDPSRNRILLFGGAPDPIGAGSRKRLQRSVGARQPRVAARSKVIAPTRYFLQNRSKLAAKQPLS